jgi:hypothetical protein
LAAHRVNNRHAPCDPRQVVANVYTECVVVRVPCCGLGFIVCFDCTFDRWHAECMRRTSQ